MGFAFVGSSIKCFLWYAAKIESQRHNLKAKQMIYADLLLFLCRSDYRNINKS